MNKFYGRRFKETQLSEELCHERTGGEKIMANMGKVLVADNDDTFRETTVALLERDGFDAIGVASAERAFATLSESRFDVALVDINMPGNTDLALVRELSVSTPSLPVIIVTGYPSVQTAATAVNLSSAAYLIKPVATDDLIRSVRRTFEQRRACQVLEENLQRLGRWNEDLQSLSRSLRPKADPAFNQSVGSFLTLTIRNIIESLIDVRNLVQILADGNVSPETAQALESSRPLVLLTALQDAVRAIERTKVSFKSRELADLRVRLESLLREDSIPTKTQPGFQG